MKIRLEGMALLALCAFAVHWIYRLVHVQPFHQPSLLELGLGLIAVVAGFVGGMLLVVGPALFRRYTWPPERD